MVKAVGHIRSLPDKSEITTQGAKGFFKLHIHVNRRRRRIVRQLNVRHSIYHVTMTFKYVIRCRNVLTVMVRRITYVFRVLIKIIVGEVEMRRTIVHAVRALRAHVRRFHDYRIFSVDTLSNNRLVMLPFIKILSVSIISNGNVRVLHRRRLSHRNRKRECKCLVIRHSEQLPRLQRLRILDRAKGLTSHRIFLGHNKRIRLISCLIRIHGRTTYRLIRAKVVTRRLSVIVLNLGNGKILCREDVNQRVNRRGRQRASNGRAHASACFRQLILRRIPGRACAKEGLPSKVQPLTDISILPIRIGLVSNVISLRIIIIRRRIIRASAMNRFRAITRIPFVLNVRAGLIRNGLDVKINRAIRTVDRDR